MYVPNVARPAQVRAVLVVDLVQCRLVILRDLPSTGPHVGHTALFDELQRAREVIRVVVGVGRGDDVARQHDEVRTLCIEHRLDQTLRRQVLLRVVAESQVAESHDLEGAILAEFERARVLIVL